MPTRSVPQGFEELHKRLVTSATETEAAKKHRQSIEECLKANFGLLRFFRSGSFGNGTNIRIYSDVDYFAWLPHDRLENDSGKALSDLAVALRKRFPTTRGIRVDSPAVVVPFGTHASEAHEIIPAKIESNKGPFVYLIPDGNGGWMRSSPEAQNDYVRLVNENLEGRLKPLIRFLKAWKYFENVPFSSFYLELVTTKYGEHEHPIIYSWDVKDVLKTLWESKLTVVEDPAGKSGKVEAYRTSLQKVDVLKKVETAWQRAEAARDCEENGNASGAFYWWDLVYDGNFPSYYY
jgi:hypothetical protein